jgi:putative ABC transport system permease protein
MTTVPTTGGRAAMRRLAGAPLRLTRGFPQDVRGAARRLLATPLFSCFAVLSLAIGVGATTAVYSVVDSLFLKGFGVDEPGRVVYVVTPYDGRMLKGSISQPDFEDLRAAQTSFSTISASAALYAAVASPSTTEFLAAEAVDGAYFSTFNVPTVIGRPIQPADVTGSARVVVLSSRLWRSRFAADPAIVGQTIRIAGRPFEVVGVAAASFEGVNGGLPDTWLWIPLSVEDAPAPHPAVIAAVPRDHRRLVVFGRLAPLVTEQTASAELGAIARRLDASFPPRPNARHAVATERPWKGKSAAALAKDDNLLRRCGLTLVGLVALVLVVACTNLANLVLARGTARQHELTIRYALGAPRWRLVREQCAESLLLAAAGAVAAYGVFQTLRVLLDAEFSLALPMGGRWTLAIHPTFDLTALGTAAAALLMSLVVFGLEPAGHTEGRSATRLAAVAGRNIHRVLRHCDDVRAIHHRGGRARFRRRDRAPWPRRPRFPGATVGPSAGSAHARPHHGRSAEGSSHRVGIGLHRHAVWHPRRDAAGALGTG